MRTDLKSVLAASHRSLRSFWTTYNWKDELDQVLGKVLTDSDEKLKWISDARQQLGRFKAMGGTMAQDDDDDYSPDEMTALEAIAESLGKLVEGADLPELPQQVTPWRDK